MATMMVLSDISTAPAAAGNTTPHGASTPAASGIAVLLDGPYRDALALRTFPQAGQKFETFALVP